MMTLDEMKLAVCEKLPELVYFCDIPYDVERPNLVDGWSWKDRHLPVNWPTEGLQVCHEAAQTLNVVELDKYISALWHLCGGVERVFALATYEQRLEALTRVWFPEKD